jgi:hypothetical protein
MLQVPAYAGLFFLLIFGSIARFSIDYLANLVLLRSIPPGAGDHFL